MDPRRLVIFHTVIQNGSIGAAARELGWTQPAVSQHLSALEKEVGMQLLIRSSGGVSPTEAGSRLAVHAAAISRYMESAATEMGDLVALKKGRVRFAAFPSAAAMLLPPTLAKLNRDFPGIDVSFTELEPPQALAAVQNNDCDVAMVFRYPSTDTDAALHLEWTPVLADPVRLLLPQGHPLAEADNLTLAQFKDEEWVAGCARCRGNLMAHANAAGFEPKIRFSTDDSTIVQRLIAQGIGVVALLPEIALEAYPNSQVVIKEVTGLDNREIGIVNRPGALDIPAISAFVNALRGNANAHGCTLTHAHIHLDDIEEAKP